MINTKYDKFIGGLYGVAIGDSLGSIFEFYNRSTPKLKWTGLLAEVPVTVQFQWHSMVLYPGSYTDDTEMSIQLLKSILENDGYEQDKTIKKYLEWANLKGTPLGKNTRALMKGVTTVKGFKTRRAKIDTSGVESNGSLMRCFPIVLLDDWRKVSDMDVALTNDNDVNRECSIIYLTVARHIIFGEPLKFKCRQKSVRLAIKNAINNVIVDVSYQKGWVVHALYVALITLFNADSYEDGMAFIAKHFLKNTDTDTIMAISGALLGSVYGFNKMNVEPLTSQNITRIDGYLETTERPSFDKDTLSGVNKHLQTYS